MNILLGITLKLIASLTFSCMSLLVKLIGSGYPTGQVVFFRSFFALIPLLVWLASRGELIDAVRTHNPLGHLRRSMIGTLGMFSGFAALSLLPLAEATALGYASPLITTALAALLLGERVRIYRWTALLVGFFGMILMLLPYAAVGMEGLARGGRSLGALFGLLGATCSAVASIEVRRLAQVEKTGAIVFYFSMTCTIAALATSVFGWARPSMHDAMLLVLAGILGGIGQILMTASFRYAPVSVIAPFDYMSLLWALLLGFIIFGDLPEQLVLIGAGLVVAAGLFVIWREHQLGVRERKEREAGLHRPT